MPEEVMKGYRLLWFHGETRGEVHLFVNPDAKPDITIRVQLASELVAWDTLLSQREMKRVAPGQGGPIILTGPKPIP